MEPITVKKKEVSNILEWESAFHDSIHWNEGRSAYSLADFVLNRDGLEKIKAILDDCGFHGLRILSCDVEVPVQFDTYRNCSHRDMVLTGELENFDKVFISVEAKVDEEFGGKIKYALKDQNTGRAIDLLQKFIPNHKIEDEKLRYQLFHALAATIEKGNYGKAFQASIMLVLVFKTKGYGDKIDYEVKKGMRNYNDFVNFMHAIHANKKCTINKDLEMWSFTYEGREIFCMYAQIDHIK